MEFRGNAFTNNYKRSDKAPDFTGKTDVAGEQHEIAVWIKPDRNGNDYLSINVKPVPAEHVRPGGPSGPPQFSQPVQPHPVSRPNDVLVHSATIGDDDLPF